MTRVLQHDRLERSLVSWSSRHSESIIVPSSRSSSSVSGSGSGASPGTQGACATPTAPMKPCATATMLQALTTGLAAVREPRMVRERFAL